MSMYLYGCFLEFTRFFSYREANVALESAVKMLHRQLDEARSFLSHLDELGRRPSETNEVLYNRVASVVM